jgi:hypothetical protein
MITASMDIETLSTRAEALVLSIGICFFDDEKEQTFEEIVDSGIELFFCRESQMEKGRHISLSTIEWWNQQGDDAKRVLKAEELITPRDFHPILESVCEAQGLSYNWVKKFCRWFTRGPHFDIAISDHLFADYNVTPPWKYYKVRDIRTWLECRGLEDNLKLVKPAGMVAHNALHDAAFDAWMMQQVIHKPLEQLEIDK